MLKQYLKQALNLMRQEKLFSSIYIVGTGLSITVVMVLSIVYYIKIANVYPETHRDRMLVVKYIQEQYEQGSTNGTLSLSFIQGCLSPLTSAEAVTAVHDDDNEYFLQPAGSREQWPVKMLYVDTAFWKVFGFRFTQGKAFSEADFLSGVRSVVIAESLARRLFAEEEATGQYISVNFLPYRVSGVVRDVSFATERVYAQVWAPYTVAAHYAEGWGQAGNAGAMRAYILAPSVAALETVREEALEHFQRYDAQTTEASLSLHGQPDRQWQTILRIWSGEDVDFGKIVLQYGLVFLILLLVPAISLSGMADSRMERRMAEIGIKRAFGAPRGGLMRQVIAENFFFTAMGGLAGLVFSWGLIWLSSDWILSLGQSLIIIPPEGTEMAITPTMLFNVPVFVSALLLCFLLNLLSAFLPAWKAAHRPIVNSLNN